MFTIEARNVNDAWRKGIKLVTRESTVKETRAGQARVVPSPVATVYQHPTERVLFDPVRDANPIFHHMEALWMLAGRDDATWLDQFVSNFSSRFAEDGGRMHGAYGKRWRDWFRRPSHMENAHPVTSEIIAENAVTEKIVERGHYTFDQLNEVVRLLGNNPEDRQAVIGMWDPSADLGVPGLKDRPCNTHIYLRADRTVLGSREGDNGIRLVERYLDMTVCCRSNDMVYGAYGANAVHMSVLQEYLAARIGARVGVYTQFSNNFHMYEWSTKQVSAESAADNDRLLFRDGYPGVRQLVDCPEKFDAELRIFLKDPLSPDVHDMENTHFGRVARPLWLVNKYRLEREWSRALEVASSVAAPDLSRATTEWLQRRMVGA